MTKFLVDMNKGLYEQSWWNLLKPEVKLKAIKHWQDTDKIVDEKISTGEIKIDPTIPPRQMKPSKVYDLLQFLGGKNNKSLHHTHYQTDKYYNNKEKKNGKSTK